MKLLKIGFIWLVATLFSGGLIYFSICHGDLLLIWIEVMVSLAVIGLAFWLSYRVYKYSEPNKDTNLDE